MQPLWPPAVMVVQMLGDAFTAVRDLACVAPWPTGIAFTVLMVYSAVKFTTLPAKIKVQAIKKGVWWEKLKPTPCSNCVFTGETYCVECKKVYCKFCACMLHHPGMKTEKHSIEALVHSEPGVKVLSPLLPDILTLSIFFVFFLMCGRVTDDQILGASYCPVIQRTRQTLVRWDPSIFYYWKGHFATFCDYEDSAWRLYIDAWFRAVVTRTDSLFLVLVAFVKAYVFEIFIEKLLAKVMGLMYGLLAVVVRNVEAKIPNKFHFLEDISKFVSLAKYIKVAGKIPPPPPTFWRRRPIQNWMEGYRYAFDRHTRLFSFYQGHAASIAVTLFRGLLYGSLAIRLACILFGADYYIRTVLSTVGFGEMMEREQNMFLGLTGHHEVQEYHKPYTSEWLFTMGFMQVFTHRAMAFDSVLEVAFSLFAGMRAALWPIAKMVFFPGVAMFALRAIYTKTIKKQDLYFNRNWPSYRQDVYGSCNRDSLIDWKAVSFKRPKTTVGDETES